MANLITIGRFPVLITVVLLLYAANPLARFVSIPLLVILIGMDSLDGVIARARKEVSLMGSVLDIMVDRAVELVLWICYADLRLIPVAIPIVYVLRGTIVDSLRSIRVKEGQMPFKAMRTRLGKWLVGSPFMRTPYGVIKLVSFAGLALTHTLAAYATRGAVSFSTVDTSSLIFNVTSWISVAFCLARGLPVIIEALLSLGEAKETIQRSQ